MRLLIAGLSTCLALLAACGQDDEVLTPDTPTPTNVSPPSASHSPSSETGDEVWTLTITRADGTKMVMELREGPIVCDMDQDRGIVWLCGVNLQGIAVDFIPVNESLGESYTIQSPTTPAPSAPTPSPTVI